MTIVPRSVAATVSLTLALAAIPAAQGFSQEPLSIRGGWRPTSYQLKDGTRHPVDGLIVFTATDWSVVFFVLDAQGQPGRGSAEGGSYTLNGNSLTFTHRFNLSAGRAMTGLEESPPRMMVRGPIGAPTEPCTIELAGDRLVIMFPSGNRMEFRRNSSAD